MAIRPNVPNHDGYFVCSDGVIAYLDRTEMKIKNAPTFIGDGVIGEKDIVYVVMPNIIKRPQNVKDLVVGQPFVASEMIAEAYKAPAGFRPAHKDGDTTNLALSNLILREEEEEEEEQEKGPKAPPVDLSGPTPCPHCTFIAPNKRVLTFHLKRSHPSSFNGPTDKTEGRDAALGHHDTPCPHCKFVAKNPVGLACHIRAKHSSSEVDAA